MLPLPTDPPPPPLNRPPTEPLPPPPAPPPPPPPTIPFDAFVADDVADDVVDDVSEVCVATACVAAIRFKICVFQSIPGKFLVVSHKSIRGCVLLSVRRSVGPSVRLLSAGRDEPANDLFCAYELVDW